MHLDFQPDGIRRLAEIAFAVNEKQENIGARRLYTVMERLLDDVSFHATRHTGETIAIDAAYVDARLAGIAGDDNLVALHPLAARRRRRATPDARAHPRHHPAGVPDHRARLRSTRGARSPTWRGSTGSA